jgi:hypothetical protein
MNLLSMAIKQLPMVLLHGPSQSKCIPFISAVLVRCQHSLHAPSPTSHTCKTYFTIGPTHEQHIPRQKNHRIYGYDREQI